MYPQKRLPTTLGSTNAFQIQNYISETAAYAVAVDSDGLVAATWNPSDTSPNGFPHTFSHQQWFILPEPIARMVLAADELVFPSTAN
jgi:hypothetical protein